MTTDETPPVVGGFDFKMLEEKINSPDKIPSPDASDRITSSSKPVHSSKRLPTVPVDNNLPRISNRVAHQFALLKNGQRAAQLDNTTGTKVKRAMVSNITQAVSQDKLVARYWSPKVKGILPGDLYDKDRPEDTIDSSVKLSPANAKLISIVSRIRELSADKYIRSKSDEMIRDRVTQIQHTETSTILSQVLNLTTRNNAFFEGTFKKYLMTSIELKFKHIFLTKDILKYTKMTLSTLSSKFDAVKHNTSLPDTDKRRFIDDVKSNIRTNLSKAVSQAIIDKTKAPAAKMFGTVLSGGKKYISKKYRNLFNNGPIETDEVEPKQYNTRNSIHDKIRNAVSGFVHKIKVEAGTSPRAYGRPDMSTTRVVSPNHVPSHLENIVHHMSEMHDKSKNTIDNALLKNGNDPVPFDVLTRRSIVDIIPGFLSKLHKESSSIAKMIDILSKDLLSPSKHKFFDKHSKSEELVFDRSTGDYVSKEKFAENTKNTLFGNKEDRTKKIQPLINALHKGFTEQGGDSQEFEDALPNIVKFVTNISKHAKVVKIENIKKYLAGGKLSRQEQDYLDAILVDIPKNARKRVLKIIGTTFHKDGNSPHGNSGFDKIVRNIARHLDDSIGDKSHDVENLEKIAQNGDHRHIPGLVDVATGRVNHEAVRKIHNDVDVNKLKANLGKDIPEDISHEEHIVRNVKAAVSEKVAEFKRRLSRGAADRLSRKTHTPNRDSVQISGPGVYIQGAGKELHVPLDNLHDTHKKITDLHNRLVNGIVKPKSGDKTSPKHLTDHKDHGPVDNASLKALVTQPLAKMTKLLEPISKHYVKVDSLTKHHVFDDDHRAHKKTSAPVSNRVDNLKKAAIPGVFDTLRKKIVPNTTDSQPGQEHEKASSKGGGGLVEGMLEGYGSWRAVKKIYKAVKGLRGAATVAGGAAEAGAVGGASTIAGTLATGVVPALVVGAAVHNFWHMKEGIRETKSIMRSFFGSSRRMNMMKMRNGIYNVPEARIFLLADLEKDVDSFADSSNASALSAGVINDYVGRFKFDKKNKDQVAFFTNWYWRTFIPIFMFSRSILKSKFNINFADQEDLSEDQVAEYKKLLESSSVYKQLKGSSPEVSPEGFKKSSGSKEDKPKEEPKEGIQNKVAATVAAVSPFSANYKGTTTSTTSPFDVPKPGEKSEAQPSLLNMGSSGVSSPSLLGGKPSTPSTPEADPFSTKYKAPSAEGAAATSAAIAPSTKEGPGEVSTPGLLSKSNIQGSTKPIPISGGGKNWSPRTWKSIEGPVLAKLKSMGWTDAQAAGLASNVFRESTGNPGAVGDGGHAYGIGQWHKDRQQAFEAKFGHSIKGSTIDEQLEFMNYELRQGTEKSAGKKLMMATTAKEAGATVSRYYERPGDKVGEMGVRGAAAEEMLARNAGKPTSTTDVASAIPGAKPEGGSADKNQPAVASAGGEVSTSAATAPDTKKPGAVDNAVANAPAATTPAGFNLLGPSPEATPTPALTNIDKVINPPSTTPAPVAPPSTPAIASNTGTINVNDPESKQQTSLLSQQNVILSKIASLLDPGNKQAQGDNKEVVSKLDSVIADINQNGSGAAACGNSSDAGGNTTNTSTPGNNNTGINVSRPKVVA